MRSVLFFLMMYLSIRYTKGDSRNNRWFHSSIQTLINHRDKIYSSWKRFGTAELHVDYRIDRTNVNKIITCGKSAY